MPTNPRPALYLPTESGEGSRLLLLPEGTTRADIAAELEEAQTRMAEICDEESLPDFVLVRREKSDEEHPQVWVDHTAEPSELAVDEEAEETTVEEALSELSDWVEATLA